MIRLALRQLAALLVLALVPALVSGAVQLRWDTGQTSADGAAAKSGGIPRPRLHSAAVMAESEVTMATVAGWGDQVQWVDARAREAFDHEHVPGAVLLNEDEWDQLVPAFLDGWDPEKRIVIYCDGGACEASHAVAKRLRDEMQLQNVWVLKGGWDAWQAR